MEITRNMLYFWIRKRWSHAVNIEVGLSRKAYVTRPMFWSSAQEMRGHLVLVDVKRMEQIDRFYPDTIFVCVGGSEAETFRRDNEWILVPDEDRMDKVFNYIATIFDKFYAWEAQLDQAANEFFSYDAIIRSSELVLEDPLSLIDADFNYVAYAKKMSMERGYEELYVDETGRLPPEVINMLVSSEGFAALAKKKGVWRYETDEAMLHCNVFHEDQFVARMSIPCTNDPARNAYNADIVELVTGVVENLYARLGTFFRQPAKNAKLRHLLAGLVKGDTPARNEIIRQIGQIGFDERDTYRLVQVRPQLAETTRRFTSALLAHLEMVVPQSVCFMVGDKCFLLIDESKRDAAARKRFANDINTFLRENYMLAGVSREFENVFDLKNAAYQTDIAIAYGRSVDPMFWYLKYDNYAFRYALGCMSRDLPEDQVASSAIGVLQKYDEENGTNLGETLHTYIEARYNAVEAAKALFISRSTFLRRIDSIRKLTGIDLDSCDDRLYLELSYRILDPNRVVDVEIA